MAAEALVVVGAGFYGLCAAWHARRRGLEPLLIDDGEGPGGAWRRFPRDLVCLSPRRFDRFPDGSFPQGHGPYARAPEVVRACEAFADREGLAVRAGRVERVERAGGGGFHLETSDGSLRAAGLVWATGVHGAPRVPELLGRFGGWAAHVASLGPEGTAAVPPGDGPVVVVGAGNSGAEAALALHGRGEEVVLAAAAELRSERPYPSGRRGSVRWALSGLPVRLLPGPLRCRPEVPLVGDALPAAVRAGRIRLVGAVRALRDRGVLVDGAPGRSDAPHEVECTRVLWATGYRRASGPLAPLVPLDVSGLPVAPRPGRPLPGLALAGLSCERTRRSGFLRGACADSAAAVRWAAQGAGRSFG